MLTCRAMSRSPRRVRGQSLVEVMVAIVVFAVGLLGVAAMMMQATRATTNALTRSQAAILSSYIVERMRSNPVAVEAGAFDNVAVAGDATRTSTPCSGATPSCSPAAIAAADVALWRAQLAAELPEVSGSLRCERAAGLRACTISLSWMQAVSARETASDATDGFVAETYQLAFTP